MLVRGHTEGHRGEPMDRGVLACRIIGRAVSHGRIALLHSILDREGGHQLSTAMDGETQPSVRHGADDFRKAGYIGADTGRVLGESRGQVPRDIALRDSRAGKGCGRCGNACATGQKVTSFHHSLLG